MHSQHRTDTAAMEILLSPRNTCTPLFYGLPKIHKPNSPLHPIFSGCHGATDRHSSYITHFIQALAGNLPSHIKDTKHFLDLTENLPPPPTKSLPYTQTFHMMIIYQPSLILQRNTSISYLQSVHLPM